MTKHSLKTIILFIIMIIIGLIGVFFVSNSEEGGNSINLFKDKTEVAK